MGSLWIYLAKLGSQLPKEDMCGVYSSTTWNHLRIGCESLLSQSIRSFEPDFYWHESFNKIPTYKLSTPFL